MLKKRDEELLPLFHSNPSKTVTAWNLPRSDKLAKLIPCIHDKKKYLVWEMGLHSSVVNTLTDKDLIVAPDFQTALFYCCDNGPHKAIKIFDQQSISEILKNKRKDFKRTQYVKGEFNYFFIFHFRG